MKYLILGNGVAGVTAAETIRQFDPAGDITMIGDESFPPYSRPMISLLLEGSISADSRYARPGQESRRLRLKGLGGFARGMSRSANSSNMSMLASMRPTASSSSSRGSGFSM